TVGRIGGARTVQCQCALLPVLAPRAWSRHGGQALARGLAAASALAVLGRWRRDLGEQFVCLERPCPRILVLEQQPLRLPGRLAGAHQVPAPLELAAMQLEAQVALGELFLRIAGGGPDAMVEARDMAAAILALGDLALEAGVVQRMVLDLHRHALDRRVVARPLRHRPALERVADLQPEVVVAAACVEVLDNGDGALLVRHGLPRPRDARAVEAALAQVIGQDHATPITCPGGGARPRPRGPPRPRPCAAALRT